MSSLHTYTLPPHLIGVINVLINLTAVIISQYIYQIITSYILSIHYLFCQLHLNKVEKNKTSENKIISSASNLPLALLVECGRLAQWAAKRIQLFQLLSTEKTSTRNIAP